MTINPNDYMLDLKGKQYLPVAPRVVMMREKHEDWQIDTELLTFGEKALVKATLRDSEGRRIATAHKTVVSFRGGDIEKAETGAIGRALSLAGFGTIQAGDLDEGEQIADSPQPVAAGPNWGKATKQRFIEYCIDSIPRYDNVNAVTNAIKVLGFTTFPKDAKQREAIFEDLKAYASFRDAGMDKDAALAALRDGFAGGRA